LVLGKILERECGKREGNIDKKEVKDFVVF
jgi:hypothetical protein